MGYIYRYTDLSDNIIKYVGIVWGKSRTLKQRIHEHKKEWWYKNTSWKIEYINADIDSRTDAEYFESHYISLYGTDKYFNSAKSGWGVSKYLPDREKEWRCYKEEDFLPDYDTPFDSVKKILQFKFPDDREHFYRSLSNRLTRSYMKEVFRDDMAYKKEMDSHLNNFLFGKDDKIARFTGQGKIHMKFPGLVTIEYVDYKDAFVSPFDATLIKRDQFASYVKKYLEDYFSKTIGVINNTSK